MIGGKINLSKLVSVITTRKGKDGDVEGIFIPIKNNHLFKSEKTKNVYLDLIGFEIENPKYDDTHLLKQSLPKEVREGMSEEDKKNQAIIGGLNTNLTFGGGNSTVAEVEEVGADDDLPF